MSFFGSNPPTANFFRLLCSVHLPQKVRGIFGLKTQKTGPGLAMIAIPKPVFSGFTVFWAIFALKARKLPDLSGRQIRQSIWEGCVQTDGRQCTYHKEFAYTLGAGYNSGRNWEHACYNRHCKKSENKPREYLCNAEICLQFASVFVVCKGSCELYHCGKITCAFWEGIAGRNNGRSILNCRSRIVEHIGIVV